MDDKIDDVCVLMKDRRLDILCVNEINRKGVYAPDMSKPLEEQEEFRADITDVQNTDVSQGAFCTTSESPGGSLSLHRPIPLLLPPFHIHHPTSPFINHLLHIVDFSGIISVHGLL
ncbi:hypothetical protein EVAR_22597_1 [Eumeta japonica]|uniref:Uncharacterized protein n=1 Tax=Eumeta variegata TaxID=151549 RepID=A0A4C1U7K8_EUMVA|nr:hypothetical protein EVAR_22597_1 [Eumeta japonica]